MTEYRHSGHAVWDIKYHLVWITKYRYKVLAGEVGERARDLLRQICAAREVRIIGEPCRPTISACWWSCHRSWLLRSLSGF